MTDDDRTARQERDSFLVVNTLVGAASTTLVGYRGWIIEEVKELVLRCAISSATCGEPLHSILEGHLKRMTDIKDYEVYEATKALNDKIGDINAGDYDNVVEARRYLEEAIYRFDSLVRECMELRRLLDGLQDPPDDGDDDD